MPCSIEKKEGLEIHLYDICGTLYHSNTTYDFLLFYFKKYDFKKFLVCRIALSLPSKMAYVILSKIKMPFDIRKRLIFTLRHESKERVEKEAMLFAKEYLSKRKNEQVHQVLDETKSGGHDIILISASIYPVVKAIAELLDIKKFKATTLDIVDNAYTGSILADLKGRKLNVWEEMGFEKGLTVSVATDNLDDIGLIHKCDKAIIVSKRKNLSFWKAQLVNHQNWRFINA